MSSRERLGALRLFQSEALDEARDFVARAFCPHRLDLDRPATRLDAIHNHAPGRDVSLNYLRYGAAVTIEPGELSSFYLIQIPVVGSADVRNGGRSVTVAPGQGTILNPTLHTRMRWSETCAKLLVRIDRAALTRVAESLTGHHLSAPILFEPELRFDHPATAHFRTLVLACFAAAEAGQAFTASRDATRQRLIEEGLMAALLNGQPSIIEHAMAAAGTPPSSRQLRRACGFIDANLAGDFTIADVAGAAGCSVRSLQLAFRGRFGTSPLQYWRRRRLALARFHLGSGAAEGGVGAVAFATGHIHLGRFATDYRSAFGEAPSATLRRAAELAGRSAS
ncbi:AraC family transcriptional regulator [Prosthecodimorpha staleyi]|uniref:AraC family transcriptional regulator n=1 Tax=Prosthecodimorpha staleyi TaxID=2840188 RepID=A0A947CZT2_9HYPH|nr:AraC family transcriptional regulator [Prosthecodimorpha staleyi]MBT9287926.1 AraC family transcriptional regulator [Prosthecodimorpha staleyi]